MRSNDRQVSTTMILPKPCEREFKFEHIFALLNGLNSHQISTLNGKKEFP